MSTPVIPAAPAALPQALTHLFRHSLREGRVHPLLHVVQRYRQAPAR
ncbi:hypothetical protein [uncultured Aquincola sp.]|tara:strand:- start:3809 stop:3949 length:141 start_codon:yes stop_codon:yes gene_type:complete